MHGILVETEKELVGQEREKKDAHAYAAQNTSANSHSSSV